MSGEARAAFVAGTGSYLPEKVLTNTDLEKMVDTSNEWILERTGIRERRIADDGTATSDLGVEAARKALASAGVEPEALDMIVVATITPDMFFPSTACLIQDRLGARNAAAFDLGAACSGFLYGLAIAKQFVGSETYDNVLVVAAEKITSITDWTDRNTCVLFGDGAGAALVSAREGRGRILSTYLGADGSVGDLLRMPGGGSRHPATHETVENRLHFLKMEGKEVFKHAVKAMAGAAKRVLKREGVPPDRVRWLVPHQANMRILKAVAKRIGIPVERVFVNVDRYGNMSAASTPVALDEVVREGNLKEGDYLLLDTFGGGFTWGGILIRW